MIVDNGKEIIYPPHLTKGDKVVIVSPAGAVNPEFVEKEAEVLRHQGWEAEIAPHALGRHLTYSGTYEERLADIRNAFLDPQVKAIFCARGGYGCVQLLEALDRLPLRGNAKWVAGYSDISALHALMASHGIVSLHAPMARHISESGGKDQDCMALFSILSGSPASYRLKSHDLNRQGTGMGKLVGGNLAVLSALIGTRFDPFEPGIILFIEDIAEPVYKVERILHQLKLSGRLGALNGLVVGQFTEYKPIAGMPGMYEMINEMVGSYDYPVVFDAPIGHVPHNIPIPVSSRAVLAVEEVSVTISCEPLS